MYRDNVVLRSSQGGFTLAELLVSLAVGALLLSLGVPSYSQFTQNTQQITSANQLLSSLHGARDLAVTRNARVTVCASVSGESCGGGQWHGGWIAFVDTNANRVVDAGESVSITGDPFDGVKVSTEQFPQFLLYRPNGRIMVDNVRANAGEFTLCDRRGSEHARVVQIDISGRPVVAKKSADGSPPVCGT